MSLIFWGNNIIFVVPARVIRISLRDIFVYDNNITANPSVVSRKRSRLALAGQSVGLAVFFFTHTKLQGGRYAISKPYPVVVRDRQFIHKITPGTPAGVLVGAYRFAYSLHTLLGRCAGRGARSLADSMGKLSTPKTVNTDE